MRSQFLITCAAVAALVAMPAPRASAQCQTCSPYSGCQMVAAGFLTCWAAAMGGVPVCMLAGPCPDGGWGGETDVFPKRRSPLIETAATPAGIEELRLYWVTVPVDEAIAARYAGRSAVIHGGSDPERPHTMTLALARATGLAPGRVRAANAEALVGPPALTASFAGADGEGYTIDAAATPDGARAAVCRLAGRMPAGRLAEAELRSGDLLIVPLRLDGAPCLMALVAGDPDATRAGGVRAEQVQRAFHEAGRRMTAASGHHGFRMELMPEPVGCR